MTYLNIEMDRSYKSASLSNIEDSKPNLFMPFQTNIYDFIWTSCNT